MDQASAGAPPADTGYPALRTTRRVLVTGVILLAVVYYNVDLVPMVGHTLIPFAALFGTGLVLGFLAPRRLAVASFTVWWVAVLASVLRRAAVADLPLGSQIFDGALKFYPNWAVWLAEVLRQGVYLWALWLGGKTGRRLFRKSAEATP